MTDTIDLEELTGAPPAAFKPKAAKVWAQASGQWYVEPTWATALLLQRERFIGPVQDPCCGQGNIVEGLRAGGHDAVGYDLVRRTSAPWFVRERDFLEATEADNIVMNPPFERAKGTERFIRHALSIAKGKVACFAPLPFLAGGRRGRGLWREHPPARIYIHSDRPSCPPGEFLLAGGEAKGGTEDFLWLVWDSTAPPSPGPTVHWLWRSE